MNPSTLLTNSNGSAFLNRLGGLYLRPARSGAPFMQVLPAEYIAKIALTNQHYIALPKEGKVFAVVIATQVLSPALLAEEVTQIFTFQNTLYYLQRCSALQEIHVIVLSATPRSISPKSINSDGDKVEDDEELFPL